MLIIDFEEWIVYPCTARWRQPGCARWLGWCLGTDRHGLSVGERGLPCGSTFSSHSYGRLLAMDPLSERPPSGAGYFLCKAARYGQELVHELRNCSSSAERCRVSNISGSHLSSFLVVSDIFSHFVCIAHSAFVLPRERRRPIHFLDTHSIRVFWRLCPAAFNILSLTITEVYSGRFRERQRVKSYDTAEAGRRGDSDS